MTEHRVSDKGVYPERIQLSRKKGWRMPPNTVKVSRPGRWGNPFRVGGYFAIGVPSGIGALRFAWVESLMPGTETDARFVWIKDAALAVEFYRKLLETGYRTAADLAELRGKNLACWCPLDQPCHADVLLEIANK